MNKKLVTLFISLLLISVVVTGTLAYFTRVSEPVHNVITTGDVDIALIEKALNDKGEEVPFENVEGVMPGQSVSKRVRVENTGSGDAWVRIYVKPAITLKDKTPGDPSVLSIDFDTANWTQQGDYWYYNHVLKAGATTPNLFENVTFTGEDMGNVYQGSTVTVTVRAEAVQSANNTNSALTAGGWPTAN